MLEWEGTKEGEDLSTFPKAGIDAADDNSRKEERRPVPVREEKKIQAVPSHACLRRRGVRQKDYKDL